MPAILTVTPPWKKTGSAKHHNNLPASEVA
jgi:hypothetical protein